MSSDSLYPLAESVGAALKARGLTLVAAESCTGGWISQAITSVAGSSNWFERGYVTYSNRAKSEMLGVADAILDRHGAVSEPTVLAMAQGALGASGADVAVAVSGIAGPDGGTPSKPVGMVCIAWQLRGAAGIARTVRCQGNREEIRRQAVAHALSGILSLFADSG